MNDLPPVDAGAGVAAVGDARAAAAVSSAADALRARGALPEGFDAAAAQRAAGALAKLDPEGVRALMAMNAAMGLRTVRVLLGGLAAASHAAGGEALAAALAALDAAFPDGPAGCLDVEFFDALAQKPACAKVLVDGCARRHSLDKQIEKVCARIAPGARAAVRAELCSKHFTTALQLARDVYARAVLQNPALIRALAAGAPDSNLAHLAQTTVDGENATFYVTALGPESPRMGIFVRF